MFCAFAVSLSQACAAVWEANLESFSPDAGRLLCERVDREPDSLFCVQMSGGTIDDLAPGQSVFRKAWSCSRKNVVTLGGWNFPLKPVQRKLKEMGWEGQSSLNLCRDNVYIVCLTPQGDVSDMDSKFMGCSAAIYGSGTAYARPGIWMRILRACAFTACARHGSSPGSRNCLRPGDAPRRKVKSPDARCAPGDEREIGAVDGC